MKEFNPVEAERPLVKAIMSPPNSKSQERRYPAYIGLDVHKDTIAWAIAHEGRSEPEYRGEIANRRGTIDKLIKRINEQFSGEVLLWCYEAGPCGYGLHRQLLECAQECQVVAPSKIPRQPGERIKTDRRDAIKLARLLRSGDLSGVWVPDVEQEAMRDLTRARSDIKAQQLKARQQLGAYVLRHGFVYSSGKSKWTKRYYNWLEELRFEHDLQQVVLQEYINAVKEADARLARMNWLMEKALPDWSMAPVVYSLKALRGVDTLAAMILMSELGDISRFESPRQLMSYLGLVPSEHSSGSKRRQGAITLSGNGHARRVLVESAWCYRYAARQSMHLKRKATDASDPAKRIAWNAQLRLCTRYKALSQSGKNTKVVCVAVARELLGFIWDIVRHEMPKIDHVAR
jgi:transposase